MPGLVRPLEEPEPILPLASLILMPPALMAIASVYVPLRFGALLGVLGAGVVAAGWVVRKFPRHPGRPPLLVANVLAVGLVLVLAMIPSMRLPLAPGADQAMYSAIARGIADSSPGISPAWGELTATIYPRGYPALLAAVGTLVGTAKASLIVAGLALLIFTVSLGAFLREVGLGPAAHAMAAALVMISPSPQVFFAFGGSSTTLALGLGLLGGRHLLAAGRGNANTGVELGFAVLFFVAALATHPIGGLAPLTLAAAVFLVLLPNRRPVVLVPALVAVAGFVVLAMQGGPEVSDAERVWISEWARGAEAVFRRAVRTPWGLYQAGWDALGPGLALTVTIGTVTSLLQPRFRRLGLFALSGAFAFLVAEAVGPHIPALAPLAYAARLIPVLAIGLAIPSLALIRQLALRTQWALLVSFLMLGTWTNIRIYQSAPPLASAADLQVIACLDRWAPRAAAINGAYGDATQWIPALTGRAVSTPHVHISFRDEFAAERQAHPVKPTLHFVGERILYGGPTDLPPGGTEICRSGKARFFREQPIPIATLPAGSPALRARRGPSMPAPLLPTTAAGPLQR